MVTPTSLVAPSFDTGAGERSAGGSGRHGGMPTWPDAGTCRDQLVAPARPDHVVPPPPQSRRLRSGTAAPSPTPLTGRVPQARVRGGGCPAGASPADGCAT